MSLFILSQEQDPRALLEGAGVSLPVQLLETGRERVTYLDTFDWRLMDGGFTLVAVSAGRRAVRLRLTDAGGGIIETRAQRLPAFASDLPEGPLRAALLPLSKIRRLLPKARALWSGQLWAVLNEDEKTVVRIHLREGSAGTPERRERDLYPIPPRLHVLALKGYNAEFRQVIRTLRKAGARPAKDGNELLGVLDDLGRPPERHASSVVLPLEPTLRAEEATRRIHRELLLTMEVNHDGVLKDLDPEFLHEFRVAVRRARSALTQIKGVFPEPVVHRVGEEFRWLGSRTGPTRDMDVYLLKIPSYQAALPEGVGQELIPLVGFLEKKKRQAHRQMCRALESRRYHDLVGFWAEFLDTPGAEVPRPPNAGRPVVAVAGERILTVYHRILKQGRKIRKDTPAEALHRLRIECKKLRYLISFFQSLYPAEEVRALIKALKGLQDNLGDFNDLRVQALALRSFAEEMLETGVGPPATLMAMGQLMGQLEAEQALERRAFHKRFAPFAGKENRTRFEELFG